MTVTDLNGSKVEVTDLQLAIMQADDYRHYRQHGDSTGLLNSRQQIYWQDMYEKLINLEQNQNHDRL